MNMSHQQYLIFSLKNSVERIEAALKADDRGHPALIAERKTTIIQNLDNLHRHLEQVEPVLREQNQ